MIHVTGVMSSNVVNLVVASFHGRNGLCDRAFQSPITIDCVVGKDISRQFLRLVETQYLSITRIYESSTSIICHAYNDKRFVLLPEDRYLCQCFLTFLALVSLKIL